MVTRSNLATFSDWLMVDHLQISDEQVSWWIADWRCWSRCWSSAPPNTNRSPLISRMECPCSFFGNGGPNVSKEKKKWKNNYFMILQSPNKGSSQITGTMNSISKSFTFYIKWYLFANDHWLATRLNPLYWDQNSGLQWPLEFWLLSPCPLWLLIHDRLCLPVKWDRMQRFQYHGCSRMFGIWY